MNKTVKQFAILAGTVTVMMTAGVGTSAAAGIEKRCQACHSFEKGVPGKIAPSLYGVIGRKAGTSPSYDKYSKALKDSGITWTEENLRKWVEDSQKMIPGVRMPSQKIRGEKADEVIAFLKTLS